MTSSNKQPILRRDTRVFISAVSRELGSARLIVKKGLEDNDYHAVEQTSFPPDYRDLVEKLRERIQSCDAVIQLVGHCFGAEPKQPPDGADRRSYTQLEYDLAVELGKPVYVFLMAPGFTVDEHEEEDASCRRLQEEYRRTLSNSEREYITVYSPDQLDQKIRSLQLRVETLRDELTAVDQQVVTTARQLRLGLAALAVLALVSLGIGLYVIRQQQSSLDNELQQMGDGLAQLDEKLNQVPPESDLAAKLFEDPDVLAGKLRSLQRDKFNHKIADAKRAGKDWQEIDALVSQRDEALRRVDRLVEMVVENLSEQADSVFKEATRILFAEGVDEAIEYLETKETSIEEQVSAHDEEIEEHIADRRKLMETWLLQASTYSANLDWDNALRMTRKCCQKDPLWFQAQRELGSVLMSMFHLEEAAAHFEKAMILAETDEERFLAATELGMCRLRQADYEPAEPLLREAIASAKRAFGDQSAEFALAIGNLAGLAQQTSRMSEAEGLFRESLAIDEVRTDADMSEKAGRIGNLAWLYRETDRLEIAEPLMWRAIEIDRLDPELRYGSAKQSVYALHLNNLGLILKAAGRIQMAETFIRHSLVIAEGARSANHPEIAVKLNNLSLLSTANGRLEVAEGLSRRALAIDEFSYRPDHPKVARDLNNLSLLLDDTQRKQVAGSLLLRALRIEIAINGWGHENTALKLGNLAWHFAKSKRYGLAEKLMKHVIEIEEAIFKTEHSHLAIDLTNLALVLEVTGRMQEAARVLRRARDIDMVLASRRGSDDPDAAGRLDHFRRVLASSGVAADEIDQQVNRLSEVSPLPPIMPKINQWLGAAPPLREVVESLVEEDEAAGPRSSVGALSLDEPVTPLLGELIGPSPLDLPMDEPVSPVLGDLIGPLMSLEDALEQLKQRYEQEQRVGIWSVPIGDPVTPQLNRLLGPPPQRSLD